MCTFKWFGPLPPHSLKRDLLREAEVAVGSVGLPVWDPCPSERTETPSPHGSSPASVTKQRRMYRLHVGCHIHLEDLQDHLRPGDELAAHFAQGTPAGLFQVSLDFMRWTFSLPYCEATKTTQASAKDARKN